MGLSRDEFFGMCLWEYNLRVHVYNEVLQTTAKKNFYNNWENAALSGQAFAGKLKRATHYINDKEDHPPVSVEELSDEDMARIDAELARRDAGKRTTKGGESDGRRI